MNFFPQTQSPQSGFILKLGKARLSIIFKSLSAPFSVSYKFFGVLVIAWNPFKPKTKPPYLSLTHNVEPNRNTPIVISIAGGGAYWAFAPPSQTVKH